MPTMDLRFYIPFVQKYTPSSSEELNGYSRCFGLKKSDNSPTLRRQRDTEGSTNGDGPT